MSDFTLTQDNVARLTRYAKARKLTLQEAINLLVFKHCTRASPNSGHRKDGKLSITNSVVDPSTGQLMSHADFAKKYRLPLKVVKARLADFKFGDELIAPYP